MRLHELSRIPPADDDMTLIPADAPPGFPRERGGREGVRQATGHNNPRLVAETREHLSNELLLILDLGAVDARAGKDTDLNPRILALAGVSDLARALAEILVDILRGRKYRSLSNIVLK